MPPPLGLTGQRYICRKPMPRSRQRYQRTTVIWSFTLSRGSSLALTTWEVSSEVRGRRESFSHPYSLNGIFQRRSVTILRCAAAANENGRSERHTDCMAGSILRLIWFAPFNCADIGVSEGAGTDRTAGSVGRH
jgi:hypothetical protein